MKTQFYPFVMKLRYYIALLITLFILNRSSAQNVNITTDPAFWGQTTVNGDLIIEGNALTSLSGMGDGFFGPNLTTVTGNLIIRNVNGPLFTSLNGLRFLTSVGGDLIVDNCDNLPNLTGLENVMQIGGSLIIKNNLSICCFTPNTHWALQSEHHKLE
jgi:hypothetical protein